MDQIQCNQSYMVDAPQMLFVESFQERYNGINLTNKEQSCNTSP